MVTWRCETRAQRNMGRHQPDETQGTNQQRGRTGGNAGHKGIEAAETAIKMIAVNRAIDDL